MKRSLLLLLVLVIAGSSHAQDYRKLKGSFHFGFVSPQGGGVGFGYTIEPGFRITDQLAVNMRLEGTIFTRDLDPVEGQSLDVGVGGIFSGTVNGVYYLMDGKFRPFVGVGLGMYFPASFEVTASVDDNTGAETGTSSTLEPDPAFGFYPRIGFDFGHFNFVVDYNIVADSESETTSVVTETNGVTTSTREVKETVTLENSYLMVKIGFTIGGGKK